MEWFPNGIWAYAGGGVLIGLSVSIIYAGTGIIAGASTFLDSTLSYISGLSRFQDYAASRDWRIVFTFGIVVGAMVYALLFQEGTWTTAISWPRLLVGGILVGIGTRLGKGCTSGHGVCGVASLSKTSILNVIIFVIVAMGMAQLMQAIGAMP